MPALRSRKKGHDFATDCRADDYGMLDYVMAFLFRGFSNVENSGQGLFALRASGQYKSLD